MPTTSLDAEKAMSAIYDLDTTVIHGAREVRLLDPAQAPDLYLRAQDEVPIGIRDQLLQARLAIQSGLHVADLLHRVPQLWIAMRGGYAITLHGPEYGMVTDRAFELADPAAFLTHQS